MRLFLFSLYGHLTAGHVSISNKQNKTSTKKVVIGLRSLNRLVNISHHRLCTDDLFCHFQIAITKSSSYTIFR